eukprot:2703974-Amphidinium_carterae.1
MRLAVQLGAVAVFGTLCMQLTFLQAARKYITSLNQSPTGHQVVATRKHQVHIAGDLWQCRTCFWAVRNLIRISQHTSIAFAFVFLPPPTSHLPMGKNLSMETYASTSST